MSRELDILNYCMESVGERAVTDPGSSHPTAQKARRVIRRMSTKIQSKGWWFNKDYNVPLSPQPNGEIILPSNTLKITPARPNRHLVRRDGKFYDPVRNTFNINRVVHCELILELSIDDLPTTAYNHLEAAAAMNMFAGDDGDANNVYYQDLLGDFNTTRSELRAEELKQSRVNSRNRPAGAYLRMGLQQNLHNGDPTRQWS